jgi:protein-S-isoprenylcysteine O-methyltransferase Ste14
MKSIQLKFTNTLDEPNKLHAWGFVFVQAVLLLLIVFLDGSLGPTIARFRVLGTAGEFLGWVGIILSAITIRTSLTAVPLPKEGGKLGVTGLYRYVRHPMYTSVLLLTLGIAVMSGSVLKYILVILLAGLFYLKSSYEERYLRHKYKKYAEYASHTPRFIPFTK